MKGIILAGGSGTRLHPLTIAVSKQLLPVYDKPMIYYPLSVLMQAGITDILVISTPMDISGFQRLLGDGSKFGISVSYRVQTVPNGIAQAFVVGKSFIGRDTVALILGDNIFHGEHFGRDLEKSATLTDGALVYAYRVKDPERYGVVEFDKSGKVIGVEEKPLFPKSNFAITGLYFYDNSVVDVAAEQVPSARGEYEITDVNQHYLNEGKLRVYKMEQGTAWLDTGTHASLQEATNYVQAIESRQGLKVCCPEEIAWRRGLISNEELGKLANDAKKTEYGSYLLGLLV